MESEAQVAEQAREFKRKLYAANVLKAKYWHEAGNGGRAVQALMDCPEDLRHWEWHRMKYLADQSEILVKGVDQLDHAVVSPDGKTILSSRRDGFYQLWDAASGEKRWSVKQSLLPSSAKLVPTFQWDGAIVFTPDSEALHLRDVAAGRSIKSFPGQFVAVYSSPNQTLGLRRSPQPSIVDLAGESSEISVQERKGRWKYVIDEWNELLFDLETDPSERRDLSYRHPSIRQGLRRLLDEWETELPKAGDL